MNESISNLLIPIIAALIGGCFSIFVYRLNHSRKKIRILEFPLRYLTSELERSGFDFELIKNGKSLGTVFQKTCIVANVGIEGVSEITILCRSLNGSTIEGANYYTKDILVGEPIIGNSGDQTKLSVKIPHLNPKSALQINLFASGSDPQLQIGLHHSGFQLVHEVLTKEPTELELEKRDEFFRLKLAFLSASVTFLMILSALFIFSPFFQAGLAH
jgi:hypothetical protein